jgi:LAO/AO transport system kinase
MQTTNDDRSQNHRELIREVVAGNYRAIARLLSIVENGSREAALYLRELYPFTGRCFAIGITGAPGVGKSTLVDRLTEAYRTMGKKVGIIAVDPTSPFSGGAILGDRIRMQSRCLDPGAFIRSMATRGHLGGLARATADALTVMDAAGFDIVIIETVGVGQGEVEVAQTADTTAVLLVPGMGDDIQNMKAGIMEIADLFVINKADHPGVEKTESELRALLSLSARPDGWKPSIVRTVALESLGINECIKEVGKYREFLSHSEIQRKETIQRQKDRIVELVCLKAHEEILRDEDAESRIQDFALQVADRKMDPYTAAEKIWNELATKPRAVQSGNSDCK